MATYAIGDVQGCFSELERLLERLRFDPGRDRLWLVGDLINRGPRSLDVVRLVRGLGDAALTVQGNHELHLLAIRYGGHSVKSGDTFDDLLNAPDADELCEWLRGLPLLVRDHTLGYVMTHAGIPHIWTLEQAEARAREVEAVIRGDGFREYFAALYGNQPDRWQDSLRGMDRCRVITNYFTRMRLVDDSGRLDMVHKGPASEAPAPWQPWYRLRARAPLPLKIVFGHWASLEPDQGPPAAVALDTGCVWGRTLTAMCLENGEITRVAAGS